jgi:alkylglycerol monooxygenase
VTAYLIALLVAAGLIALEMRVARRRGVRVHAARETWSNLGCGLLRALVAATAQAGLLVSYAAIEARWGLFELEPGALSFVIAFVAYDFVYYWVHRLSHRVPLLWATHAVHHQPRELNLTVLFRAGALAPFATFPAYASLALLGVPTAMYAAAAVVEHGVMFWLHTRLVDEPRWLGAILNTPSLHRVHHARSSEKYDRNFGGVLIVWDRLFSSFVRERAAVTSFGTAALPPLDPISANLKPFLELYRGMLRERTVAGKLRALFGRAHSGSLAA